TARRGGSRRDARREVRRVPAAAAARRARARAAAASPPRPGPTPAARSLGLQPLERRSRIDDVTLELQLRVLEAGRDADELREMEHGEPERPPRRRLELLLPCVEREMAERARRHHHVRTRLERLLDWLDELAHRRVLSCLDDREPATLDLRRIVDRLAAACLDDPLERPRPIRVLEAHDLRRPQDLAAVEGRDLQALQPFVRRDLELLVALALRDLPQQVADVDRAAVRRHADRLQIAI